MSARDQQIIDALQASIPRAQMALTSLQRTHDDVAAILESLAHAAQLFRPPSQTGDAGRHIRHLDVAIVRSGHAVAEVSFLTAIPEARIRSIAAGDAPTPDEAKALMAALPDWKA